MRRRYSTERLPGMERMELSNIQPCEIKHFVKEALLGFNLRQKYREMARKIKREAKKKRLQSPKIIRLPKGINVKSPIVFRAEFSGPKWTTFKIPGKIGVEVYHSRIGPPAEWKARRPGAPIDFEQITPQSQPGTLRRQVVLSFRKQESDWKAFDTTSRPAVELSECDWAIDNQGKVYFTQEYLANRAVKIAGVKT